MTDENEEQKETLKEKLEAVGQIIIGELETVGGILTADPITHAEGEFNVEAGTLHLESSDALDETEETESEKSNQKE
jgi:hypothetical protein